jgi:hypothetical protein
MLVLLKVCIYSSVILVLACPKFRRILPELLSVVGRTAIRIHAGNSYKDSQGCILVGGNDKSGWLSRSKFYEQKLVKIIAENESDSEIQIEE